MNAFQFFKAHAGYSYGIGETKAQGQARSARMLAKAERQARDGGFSYRWSIDPDIDSSDWHDDEPHESHCARRFHAMAACDCAKGKPYSLWQCAMYNGAGQIVASLHGIDFGRDGAPWSDPYKRVVEAELALEGLENEPQGEAREVQTD